MKHITQFLAILLIITSLFSCNNDSEEICCIDAEYKRDYYYHTISENLHPLLFNKGSYWIYNNNVNSSIDTLVLIDIKIDTLVETPSAPGIGPPGENKTYNLTYKSTLHGESEEQYIGTIITQGSIYGGYKYFSSHDVGDERSNALISDIYDSLLVNSKYYYHVVKMELTEDKYLSPNMNLYYVDSVGVIRKEIKDGNHINKTWDLVKYDANLLDLD